MELIQAAFEEAEPISSWEELSREPLDPSTPWLNKVKSQ